MKLHLANSKLIIIIWVAVVVLFYFFFRIKSFFEYLGGS
jgi:hypothetical protein